MIDYTKHNWLVFKYANQWLSDWAKHIRGMVYDLGCGERPYEEFILQYADKYVGVDWSNTLHLLKADIVADMNKPLTMIDAASADTVFSVSVMEHLSEPQMFLNESFRILRQGGAMLLQVPFQWHVHEEPYDYYRYTENGLKYMCKKAGFEKVTVTPTTGFWSTMALKVNYHSLRYIRGPRFLRAVLGTCFIPVWFVGQYTAFALDRFDFNKKETAGYTVVAFKGAGYAKRTGLTT